jgi:hypothetical protein
LQASSHSRSQKQAHTQRLITHEPHCKYMVARSRIIANQDHGRVVGTKRPHILILIVNVIEAAVAQSRPSQDIQRIIRGAPCHASPLASASARIPQSHDCCCDVGSCKIRLCDGLRHETGIFAGARATPNSLALQCHDSLPRRQNQSCTFAMPNHVIQHRARRNHISEAIPEPAGPSQTHNLPRRHKHNHGSPDRCRSTWKGVRISVRVRTKTSIKERTEQMAASSQQIKLCPHSGCQEIRTIND